MLDGIVGNPLIWGVLIGGFLLLGLLVLVRRGGRNRVRKVALAREESRWGERAQRSSKLVAEFEHRTAELLVFHEQLAEKVEIQRQQLLETIARAEQSQGQLNRLIDLFEETFFGAAMSRDMTTGITGEMQSRADRELDAVKESFASLFADSDGSPESEFSLTDSTARFDSSSTGDHSRQRQIRQLLKGGMEPAKVADSMGIPLDEVELVVKILEQCKRVA